MTRPAARHGALGVLTVAVLLAGCGAQPTTSPATPTTTRLSPAAAVPRAATTTCSPGSTASYPPLSTLPRPGAMPAGTLMATIAQRGTLVVGISGDTRLLGARDTLPGKGGRPEGFDIDIAREIAKAIFGPDNVDSHLQFRVITAAERIPLLNKGVGDGGVDMVARAMTMTCDRWENAQARVAFSQVYLLAQQEVLVRNGSGPQSIQALAEAKARVCAPKGSTSIDRLKAYPGVVPVEVDIHSDCLAAWQQGEVDAITGDNTILAGFADQDPLAKVVGPALEDEPYGLAVSPDQREFVQFVNAVLDRLTAGGRWQAIYDSWLAGPLGAATPPRPNTTRPLTWQPKS
jgi:polar amino acid transport system substrate-binding protein